MKKTKKIVSFGLAAAMMFGTLSSAYAMPNNSVIIGNKGYSLDYFFNEPLLPEIVTALESGGDLFFDAEGAGFVDAWDGSEMTAEEQSQLKNIEYLQADGKKVIYENFEDETPKVEGKIVVESVSAITKTSVTVKLAADADATKAADKASYAVTVGTEEVAVTNVVYTAASKTAVLSVNLDKKEGKVAVNGTESEAFDFVAPKLSSVKALDTKHIEITFSEKVEAAGAEDIANYSLYDYTSGQLNALATSFRSGAATAKLQADGKTVIITFSGSITDGNGFILGGLTNGKYLLYVDQSATNKVQDLAKNQIVANSNFEFTGTTTPAEVSIKAIDANYSKAGKELKVTFSEPTNGTTSDVAGEKFALTNGTSSAPLKVATAQISFDATNTVATFDLSQMTAEDYAKVEALTGSLSVVISDGAYKDANAQLAKGNTVAVKETVLPVITGAEYNEETNVLKLNFDQDIDVSKIVTFAGITINAQAVGADATLKTATNGKVVEIQLSDSTAATVESSGTPIRVNTVTETAVYVPVNLFTKVGATIADPGKNVATTIAKATVVQDTKAPTVSLGIKGLDTGVGTLTIAASEELDTTIVPTTIKFYASDDLDTAIGALGALDTAITRDGTTNNYTLNLATNSSALATAIKGKVDGGKDIVAVIGKGNIKDINLTEIEEVKTTNALPVSIAEATYGEAVASVNVKTQSDKLVELQFGKDSSFDTANEIQLDKNIAENSATYEFVSKANANIKVSATANYVWDAATAKGVLRVIPSEKLIPGAYELKMTGLKTNTGKAVETPANSGAWKVDVTISADDTSPQLSAATKGGVNIADTDKSGTISAGDKIVLEFNEAVKLNGATAADFTVDNNRTLGSANVEIGSDLTKVVITLAADSTIKIGDKITVVESDRITDLAGNKIDTTSTNDTTGALAKPVGVVAPKIKEVTYADTNADGKVSKGDTLVVKFDQNVVKDSDTADLTDDIVVNGATFSAAELAGDTLTLTIDTPGDIAVGVNADVNGTSGDVNLKNGWEDKAATGTKAITAIDKVAPKVTGISYKASTNALTLTFDEAVNLKGTDTAVATNALAKLTANGGTLGSATAATLSTDYKSVTITLDGNEALDEYTTISIAAGIIGDNTDAIQDASGNIAVRGQGTPYTLTIVE